MQRFTIRDNLIYAFESPYLSLILGIPFMAGRKGMNDHPFPDE